jgi:hypothetical protein
MAGSTFCLTWTSLPGVRYYVQGVTDLGSTNWATISPTILASDYFTSYCIPLPSLYRFFRVGEGLAPNPVATINFNRIRRLPGGVLLDWVAPSTYRFNMQWAPAIPAGTWNTISQVITSRNTTFTFFDDGSQTGGLGPTRFYRLVHLP